MKTIIYATDCSTNASSSLCYAYRFSSMMKADLHVIHVYDMPPINLSTIHPKETLSKRIHDEQKDMVTKYCTTHLKNEFRKKPITIHAVENDSITNGIIKLSKKLSPDLVVLGMKDPESTRGYFSGNIANALLDRVEVPILIVPNSFGCNSLSTIVYATAFEQEDILSIKKLVEIAKPFSALIEVIHVYENDEDSIKKSMEIFKNLILKQVSYPEITFRTIASGKIKSGLLAFLKKENANMLVMLERTNKNSFNGLFHKDLVKELEAVVTIPVLAFNKQSAKLKVVKTTNVKNEVTY
ncbi:nucleotide-binding universal stress UspA family protein [Mariniflexile fucanivorans]|uniref:Nucleotide-binding universal stress UspA family protein n=1 Tax=Mariniflexile fucanivorans TaxID=264023 RepID=A0A4R1RII2_9FLAO|nr:universal stress protein [Mariniflexile fucanivorans]TCL65580.1 nucleotide-binding universal stress UspA family protein [Mariniflexile fucanivorans]